MFNQRKINTDQTKCLGVEKANCMYNNLSRLDIRLWQNIYDSGQNVETIKQSISFDNFAGRFDGISLFHHFSNRPEVLQIVSDLYDNEKAHGHIEGIVKNLPLNILFPN